MVSAKYCLLWSLALCLLAPNWSFCPVRSAGAREDLVIDRRQDWEQWSFPPGVVELTADGSVRSVRVRKRIDAALDAGSFSYESPSGPARGGIRGVGSNPADAPKVLDGDSTTSWAPDPADEVEKGWIELDLGRAVVAQDLRLIFAPEGPPFTEFRVFVATGEPRFPGTSLKALVYTPVVQTLEPNQEHVFEHLFQETDVLGKPLSGRFLQYLKIFFDRKVAGAALAGVEVTALGDNIAQGTIARGGSAVSGQVTLPVDLFDGLLWTGWRMTNLGADWLQGQNLRNGPWVRWDLGAEFWVDTIKLTSGGVTFSTGEAQTPPMDGFKLYASDGRESTLTRHEVWQVEGRNIEWKLIADVNNTLNFPDLLDDFELYYDPPEKIRYLFFHHFYGASVWQTGYSFGSKLFEFQIFGEGFIPGVSLSSPLLELGDAYVTAVEWEGDIPAGTRLEIRTRTGDEVEEVVTYYDKNGNAVTKEKYESMPRSFRGEIVTRRLPAEERWSPWSTPYLGSGEPFASPSPSKYLQLEAKLAADSPQVAPRLDRIALRLADPVVRGIAGRIEPRVAQPGEYNRFTYYLLPVARPRDPGFDRILIQTPERAAEVEVAVAGQQVTPEQVRATRDSLVISLPQPTRGEVQVGFATLLQGDNTVFNAAVAKGAGPWQRVDPEAPGTLVVRMPAFAESEALIHQLRLDPEVITPNGDGVNDAAALRFIVLKLDVPRRIAARIYDLNGRLLRVLHDAEGTSGNYGFGGEILWDGRDQSGQRVAPGVYACQLRVEGDATREVKTRFVAVVY